MNKEQQEKRDAKNRHDDEGGLRQQLLALKKTNKELESVVTEKQEECNRLRARLQFDPGGSDKIDELESAMEHLRHQLAVTTEKLIAEVKLARTSTDNVWFWQGDGHDHPESLTCPVVMGADTLRAMLAEKQRAEKAELPCVCDPNGCAPGTCKCPHHNPPTVRQDEHHCSACPPEVRDLYACAHNLLAAQGDPDRFARKLYRLEGSVDRMQRIVEAHFQATDPVKRTPSTATHRCKVCGAFWRLNPPSQAQPEGSWSLLSLCCGKCCDNEPMGDQIEELPQGGK